ncbi:MAG: IMPACT family protein, partial [Succinivibrio sp.]
DCAKEFIANITKEYSDARHNCFAYNADKPGTSGYAGCSDDGEPHGTAGQPMLNVLLHADVGEITVVVTRYFGGILLGTGGLVKAYSDSIRAGLDSLKTTPMVIVKKVLLEIDHPTVTLALRMFSRYGIEIISQEYGAMVSYTLHVPESNLAPFVKEITDLTRGRALVKNI